MGWPYWKTNQKEFAILLGGIDLGIKGKIDVENEEGCYEIKCMKHLPKQLEKWLKQAEKHISKGSSKGKTAYLILHSKHRNKLNDLIIRRVKDHLADLETLRNECPSFRKGDIKEK